MQEAGWAGVIRDISQGGVRIHLRRRFERGTGLALELPDGDRESMVLFVKVVHLKPEADGTWMLGCQFLSPIGDDLVDRLVTGERQAHDQGAVNLETSPIPEAAVAENVDEIIDVAEAADEEIQVAEMATAEFEIEVAELATAEFEIAWEAEEVLELALADDGCYVVVAPQSHAWRKR
jgi:PilZ domain